AYALGLGLVAIGIETAWRRPQPPTQVSPAAQESGRALSASLLSAYFLFLWLLWTTRSMPGFWLAVVAVALPAAIRVTRRSVNHFMRSPQETAAGTPSVAAAIVERGGRAVLIIVAALLLAHGWDIDLVELTAGDSLLTRVSRGILNVAIIALLADFGWAVIKAIIDRKLEEARSLSGPDSVLAR